MKDKILKLRSQGKLYREIAGELKIPYQRVVYYCNPNRKFVLENARKKYVKDNRLLHKITNFHAYTKNKIPTNFSYQDFLNKCAEETRCYITNTKIDLNDGGSYAIDHVIPSSRGGSNDINNAELIRADINRLKSDKTKEELFALCKEILEANNYKVTKQKPPQQQGPL